MYVIQTQNSLYCLAIVRQVLKLILKNFKGIWHWLCLEMWHVNISSAVWLPKTKQTCLLIENVNIKLIEVYGYQ